MAGQMCWLHTSATSPNKTLHLRTGAGQPWRPYHDCNEFAVPDYKIPGGSMGWATYQTLSRSGWKLVALPDELAQSA